MNDIFLTREMPKQKNRREFLTKFTLQRRDAALRRFKNFCKQYNINLENKDDCLWSLDVYFRKVKPKMAWSTIAKECPVIIEYMKYDLGISDTISWADMRNFYFCDLAQERVASEIWKKKDFSEEDIVKIVDYCEKRTGLASGVLPEWRKKNKASTNRNHDRVHLWFVLSLAAGGRRVHDVIRAKVRDFKHGKDKFGNDCLIWHLPRTKAKRPVDEFKCVVECDILEVYKVLTNYIERYGLGAEDHLMFIAAGGKNGCHHSCDSYENKNDSVAATVLGRDAKYILKKMGFDTFYYSTKSVRITYVNRGIDRGLTFQQISRGTGHKTEEAFKSYKRYQRYSLTKKILPEWSPEPKKAATHSDKLIRVNFK